MNPHRAHAAGLASMFGSFVRHRQLVGQLTRREVVSRYRGSWVGLAWSFFNPLLMLVIYTFVFSVVFKARWGTDAGDSRAGFAVVLFVGIIFHSLLAECIAKAPSLVVNNASYVKRVMFPLEILAWSTVGAALFHALVSFLVLLLAQLALGHPIPWTAMLLPVVIMPLLPVALGFVWLLASTSVFVRDINLVTGLLNTALLFLAPVFYPLAALPEDYRWIVKWNPLAFIIEQGRAVLLVGNQPDWMGLGTYTICAVLFAWLGYAWFQRIRRGFADVV